MSYFEYPDDPEHQPVRGIPQDLRASMKIALGSDQNWKYAGHAFAGYVVELWPKTRAIDHIFESMDRLITAFPDHGAISWRLAALVWLNARFPDVIAWVPRQHLLDFHEGAYRKFFCPDCWDNRDAEVKAVW